jgi:hypothetical protein
MSTVILTRAGRLWCYRVRREADLYEERVYADGVTPDPSTAYTVRSRSCALDPQCTAEGVRCRLLQPGEPLPERD